MKYLQGPKYLKPFLKKINNPTQSITYPISRKTITKWTSKEDCTTNLNIVLNNYDINSKLVYVSANKKS